MVRCNQAVEIHCAQLNLIAYRFTQPRTTRVKSLGNHLHWKGAKKLLVGHRGNSKLLLHTNHAHPHGATKIERFTASEWSAITAIRCTQPTGLVFCLVLCDFRAFSNVVTKNRSRSRSNFCCIALKLATRAAISSRSEAALSPCSVMPCAMLIL